MTSLLIGGSDIPAGSVAVSINIASTFCIIKKSLKIESYRILKHFEKVTEQNNKIILHCIFHIQLRCVLHSSCKRAGVPLLSTPPFSQILLELGHYSEQPPQSSQLLVSVPLQHLFSHSSFPTQSSRFQKSSQRRWEAMTLRSKYAAW